MNSIAAKSLGGQTPEQFYKSLSDAEFDQAEAIEAEIEERMTEGWREDETLAFVKTIMLLRKKDPGATLEGVFNVALHLGLQVLMANVGKKRRGTLTGKSL